MKRKAYTRDSIPTPTTPHTHHKLNCRPVYPILCSRCYHPIINIIGHSSHKNPFLLTIFIIEKTLFSCGFSPTVFQVYVVSIITYYLLLEIYRRLWEVYLLSYQNEPFTLRRFHQGGCLLAIVRPADSWFLRRSKLFKFPVHLAFQESILNHLLFLLFTISDWLLCAWLSFLLVFIKKRGRSRSLHPIKKKNHMKENAL